MVGVSRILKVIDWKNNNIAKCFKVRIPQEVETGEEHGRELEVRRTGSGWFRTPVPPPLLSIINRSAAFVKS